MRRLSRLVLSTLLATVAAAGVLPAARAAEPTPGPALELRQKVLFLSALPSVLDRPEVRPHLKTGLTTTFLLEVRAAGAGGQKARGGGMVEIWQLAISAGVTAILLFVGLVMFTRAEKTFMDTV